MPTPSVYERVAAERDNLLASYNWAREKLSDALREEPDRSLEYYAEAATERIDLVDDFLERIKLIRPGFMPAESPAEIINVLASDIDDLRADLKDACDLLEGWITKYCHPRYVKQHMDDLAKKRAAL